MDVKMRMPNMPMDLPSSISMKMSAVFTQKVLDVASDGSARVRTSFSGMKITSPDVPQMQTQSIPTQSMVMTVSRDGRLLGVEEMGSMMAGGAIPGMDLSQFAGQIGYLGVFPQGPVEIGQSWRSAIPMPFGSGEMNVDSTLLAAAVPVGKDVVSKIKQTYQAYIDLGEIMDAAAASGQVPAGAMSMNGGMDIVGWTVLYFSPSRGRLVKANGNIKTVMSIDMPQQAVSQGAPRRMTMNMDMNLSIKRI